MNLLLSSHLYMEAVIELGSSSLCSRWPYLQSHLASLSVEFLRGLEESGVKAEAMFFLPEFWATTLLPLSVTGVLEAWARV